MIALLTPFGDPAEPAVVRRLETARARAGGAVKVISWNVENALRLLPALPAIVEEFGGPEVLCLQELRIRQSDGPAISALTQALPGYRCHYSLPRDGRNVTFRGGRMYGVATFVQGRWLAEVPAWDVEGRVVVVRRRGLAIVNVYAVNGTSKPLFDAAGRIAGDRHELKRRFQSSVMDLGSALRKDGGVIMAGDRNVSRTAQDTHPRLRTEEPHARARAEFNARMADERLVDIWCVNRNCRLTLRDQRRSVGWLVGMSVAVGSEKLQRRMFAAPSLTIAVRPAVGR